MCFIVKYVLFFANIIFTLAGLTLIGIGTAVLVLGSEVLKIIPINLNAIPISVIVLGVIVFVIAFFGCCGSIRENRCFLVTYSIIMLLLAAGKMYLAVIIFKALDNIYNKVVEWLAKAFANETLTEPFHAVETAFQCCGTTGADSYAVFQRPVPPSCCSPDVQLCDAANAFGGCNDKVGDIFAIYGEVTATFIVVVIGVELVAMLFGFCLCKNITNRKRESV